MGNSSDHGADSGVMVEVDGLSRYYGPVHAIRHVNFRAKKGEILGFLGPNGAGKTSTMRMITGYLPPSEGTIRVAGFDVIDESLEARKEIGYLPENTPLYPDMTVAEYLRFIARLRGVSSPNDAVERVMERVSIDHRADDLIGQLSKGLKQRVGIAQALVHDPSLIILDEPTIGLDPRQIREVRSLIKDLRGDHTVILSTHILSEAQQVCDRVMIIKQGEIVAEDTPEQLTATLAGGNHVRVAIGGDPSDGDVKDLLRSIEGVASITANDDGSFALSTDGDEATQSAIAESVVGKGWSLLELTPVVMTLEDVFLELTGEAASEDLEEEVLDEAGLEEDAE